MFVHRQRHPDFWLPGGGPAFGAVIDWAHPLAVNLNAAYVFNLAGDTFYDLTGLQGAAFQNQGQPDSGFAAHNGRRCVRQAASGTQDTDYIDLPTPPLNDQDDASYGNSVSIGAAHTHYRDTNVFLLGGTNNGGGGGWYVLANGTTMGCQINSGNGFGVRTLNPTGWGPDYWQTGKWFNLTLACRYFDSEGKHRLYGNFNQNAEDADDETYNNPNDAKHTAHRLFRREYTNHYYWGGFCSHIYFWDRRFLTEDERLWINAEPWAFLRPEKIRTYVLTSEPSGGPAASPWFFQHHILRHRRGA